MNCWVQSKSEETVSRVQQLFDELQEKYEKTGDKDFKPSQFTYNARGESKVQTALLSPPPQRHEESRPVVETYYLCFRCC